MIPPHSVLIPGVIVLNDGPLHADDIMDLRLHFERNGIRPQDWVVFVTEDQLRWLVTETNLFEHDRTDPLTHRWPGVVGRVFNVTIARSTALGRQERPVGPWLTMRQPTGYTTTAADLPPEARPTMDFDTGAFKIRLGTDIAGKWFDKAWIDEKKPAPRTSHEVW